MQKETVGQDVGGSQFLLRDGHRYLIHIPELFCGN